jgi:hypothetical protein
VKYVAKVASRRTALYSTPMMEAHGIYRERNGWGDQHGAQHSVQHSVHVKYDEHQELDLSEERYRARGYQPPFEQLPWKDEAENLKA